MTHPVPAGSRLDASDILASARAAWSDGAKGRAVELWKQAIIAAPHSVPPYVNLLRAFLDLGIEGGWVETAASSISWTDPLVFRNLAVIAQQRGRGREAVRMARRAGALAPGQVATMALLAKLPASDRPGHAPVRWALRAAVADPADPLRWTAVLGGLTADGEAQAAARYAAALPIRRAACPDELLQLMYHAFTGAGRAEQALSCMTELVTRHPLRAALRRERALALRRQARPKAAIREARRAVILDAGGFEELSRLAEELARDGDFERAVRWFRSAIRVSPRQRSKIIENLGAALIQCRAGVAAGRLLREAIVTRPAGAPIYLNFGTLCFQDLDLEGAGRLWRRAIAIDAGLADAWYSLATLQRHQGLVRASRRSLSRAIELDDQPMYRFLGAMLELGDGDPVKGVTQYEVRWRVPGFSASRTFGDTPSLAVPAWRGERLSGTLALWAEQGIGDEIWFAGYIPWAAARAGRVVLEVGGSLVKLLERTLPGYDVRARDAPGTEAAMAAADAQLPVGSLMPLANAGAEPVPYGYLKPDGGRVARLRSRYLRSRPAVRQVIGISWRSVKAFKGRRLEAAERLDPIKSGRSFEAHLEQWRSLFRISDAAFVSLQYGDVTEDVRLVRELFGVELIVDPEVNAYLDLDGLAAQVAAVDRVVSVANSTVMMAHAVGTPVDVIPHIVQMDWRYRRWASRTRWLPTATCTWQRTAHDWATPIDAIARRLTA